MERPARLYPCTVEVGYSYDKAPHRALWQNHDLFQQHQQVNPNVDVSVALPNPQNYKIAIANKTRQVSGPSVTMMKIWGRKAIEAGPDVSKDM
jgi:hypothetical protein